MVFQLFLRRLLPALGGIGRSGRLGRLPGGLLRRLRLLPGRLRLLGRLPGGLLRRIILLADWASREPKRWAAYKMFYYEKVGSSTVIARKLHVAERTARRYLLPVRLGWHLRRGHSSMKPLRRLSRQSRGGDLGLNTL